MKIQCDVCNIDEASVYCSADEAALCASCDHRVHHANKLAGKHQRFSLLVTSAKEYPVCDICQEKRAFLFCQQDRAILCRDCDIPIHKANEHTLKHNRFLLTGVKLSATSALYTIPSPTPSSAASLTNSSADVVPQFKTQNSVVNIPVVNKPIVSVPTPILNQPSMTTTDKSNSKNTQINNGIGNGSTSSISEYLIDMLPGWHVEDFLDSSATPFGLCKTVDNDVMPLWDADIQGMNTSPFSSENMGIWVPQAPPLIPSSTMAFLGSSGGEICFKESKEATNIKSSRKWRDDGGYTVPQISPPASSNKRSRTLW